MLSDNEAIATVAVKDLKAAANFYEGKKDICCVARPRIRCADQSQESSEVELAYALFTFVDGRHDAY